MPLQQLVEYFNDRLEWEHHANFRPFFLKDDIVHGLFGPVRIETDLAPVRETLNPKRVLGYTANLNVTTAEIPHLQNHELASILSLPAQQSINPDSVIYFDRLARTVHMLNFLPYAHEPVFLQLEVDPRHILGVKKDHGAYFQEVIGKCGLETFNIVIVLRVGSAYVQYYEALMAGLENYRRRGYRLALKFDYRVLAEPAMALITALSPDWLDLSAGGRSEIDDRHWPQKLQLAKSLAAKVGAKAMLSDVDDRKTDALARELGFEWVAGRYYRAADSTRNDDPLGPALAR